MSYRQAGGFCATWRGLRTFAIMKQMASADSPSPKTHQQLADQLGIYPAEAFDFVVRGLGFTVERLHGKVAEGEIHHVDGRQLCVGLRDYALKQWGMMARTVLQRWGITQTMDFGRIVYAMIDAGMMRKREEDSLEDFREVYEFSAVFDGEYIIDFSK